MKYHHMGIPTKDVKKNEFYHANLKFTSTPYGANPYRIQWHRFEEDCPLHEIVKTVPHIAFQVEDLQKAIEGKKVVFGPYEPIENFKVAMIITEDGLPIEFIETTLSDEDLVNRENSSLNIEGLNPKNG